MSYQNHITSNHEIMLGKPVIKGTRVTVEMILRKLSQGASAQDVCQMYPQIELEDVNAALHFAADLISNEERLGSAA